MTEPALTTVSELATTERPTVYEAAVELVTRERKCGISFVQRKLGIGYILAAQCLTRMEVEGIVSHPDAEGKRKVLK